MTVSEILTTTAQRGVVLEAQGERLHVEAPVGALTPELRAALAQRKDELLVLLAPGEQHVTLRGGLTLPLPALRLVWDLEERGFDVSLDASEQPVVEPAAVLTDRDRAALRRWRRHVAALIRYVDEVVA